MDSIKVMISSRVGAPLMKGKSKPTVGDAAKEIKKKLDGLRLFPEAKFEQESLFHFDLSLELKAKPGGKTIDQYCREMVNKSDIVLALYNGQAGSSLSEGADGICFLEMRMAMDFSPEKLVVVTLPPQPGEGEADKRFREWFEDQRIWTAPGTAKGIPDVVEGAREALREAVVSGTRRAGHLRVGSYYFGGALEWSRMNYERRAEAMRKAVYESLQPHGKKRNEQGEDEMTLFAIGDEDERVFTWIHAIPAALSEPHAREMVGQPYLNDHKLVEVMDGLPGPLHVVACARGVTEAQAVRMLGFPDATIIKAPFGVFVADEVQKIQMAFLAQCRDEPTTHEAVSQFIAWLRQVGEFEAILKRGRHRSDLVKILAKKIS